eukprot:bmy_14452T0
MSGLEPITGLGTYYALICGVTVYKRYSKLKVFIYSHKTPFSVCIILVAYILLPGSLSTLMLEMVRELMLNHKGVLQKDQLRDSLGTVPVSRFTVIRCSKSGNTLLLNSVTSGKHDSEWRDTGMRPIKATPTNFVKQILTKLQSLQDKDLMKVGQWPIQDNKMQTTTNTFYILEGGNLDASAHTNSLSGFANGTAPITLFKKNIHQKYIRSSTCYQLTFSGMLYPKLDLKLEASSLAMSAKERASANKPATA